MRVYRQDGRDLIEDKVFRGNHVKTISTLEGTLSSAQAKVKSEDSSDDSERSVDVGFSSERSSLCSRLDDLRHARAARREKVAGHKGC
jgi:hypothetical protein